MLIHHRQKLTEVEYIRSYLPCLEAVSSIRNPQTHHAVVTGSEFHPASYPTDTEGLFPGGKAAGAWSWPLTSLYCRGQKCVELYLHHQYIFML